MKIRDSQFWKNELQTDYPNAEKALQSYENPVILFNNRRVLDTLCEHYKINQSELQGNSIDEKLLTIFKGRKDDLLQMLALTVFQEQKRKLAIETVAKKVLSENILDRCMTNGGDFDYFALLLA